MSAVDSGITFKRPSKPRFVRVVCRHACGRSEWQTYEFPDRLVIRLHGFGPQRDLAAESQVDGAHALAVGSEAVHRYKCPRCHRDLQLRTDTMLRIIDALDVVERRRAGDSAARVQKMDIAVAEHVLRFRS
jgi:hypothetical protein